MVIKRPNSHKSFLCSALLAREFIVTPPPLPPFPFELNNFVNAKAIPKEIREMNVHLQNAKVQLLLQTTLMSLQRIIIIFELFNSRCHLSKMCADHITPQISHSQADNSH